MKQNNLVIGVGILVLVGAYYFFNKGRTNTGSTVAGNSNERVVVDGEINPSPFVIVEGLYAGSPDLREVRNLHYEMPTSIATSIGRDIRRLLIENRANGSIGTPEDRLKYVMEIALPTYLKQKRPRANSFSMHSRPLAERAFMLDQLSR